MATPAAASDPDFADVDDEKKVEDVNDENKAPPAPVIDTKDTSPGSQQDPPKVTTTESTSTADEMSSVVSVQSTKSAKSLKDTIKIVPEDVQIVPEDIKIVQDAESKETVVVEQKEGDKSTTADNENNQNPLLKAREHLDKTVNESKQNLQKGLDKLNESTKDVVKKIQTSTEESWKTLQTNTSKVGNTVKERSYQTFEKVGSSTRNVMENVTSTTQRAMQEHVEPSIQRSLMAVQAIPGQSQRMLSDVSQHSQRVLEGVSTQTSEKFVQLRDTTHEQYQTHVAPKVEEFHQTHVSSKWAKVVQLHRTYAKYYMGKAPAVVEFFDNQDGMSYQLAKVSLLGCSQILYCDNPITGGLIWISLLILAPWIALGGLSSILTSSACSMFALKDEDAATAIAKVTEAGANAFLVGTFTATIIMDTAIESGASLFFFRVLPVTLILGPICWYVHLQIVSYTSAPLLWSSNAVLGVVALMTVAIGSPPPPVVVEEGAFLFMGSLASIFGAVLAAEWTGWIILFGVTLCAPILAASLVAATVVESLVWVVLSGETTLLYQASLTTVALVYHFQLTKTLMVVGFLAVLWTCILQVAFDALFARVVGISFSFTLAFCVATMPLLVSEEPLLGLEKRNLEEEPVVYVQPVLETADETEDLEDASPVLDDDDKVEESPEDEKDDDGASATEETPLISV